jgi:hypothetical protein
LSQEKKADGKPRKGWGRKGAVGYLKEKPVREEGAFLLEERTLIDVLARLIGEIMGTRLMKKAGGGA